MKYTSIARLRAEGVTGIQATDQRLHDAIYFASRKINTITDQYFTTIRKESRLSGRGTQCLLFQNLIPIVKVFTIKDIVDNVVGEAQDPASYVVDGRLIQSPSGTFAEGTLNFAVDAITGWIEDPIEFTASTTELVSIPLSGTEVSIPLTSTLGLQERSIILLPDGRSLFVNSVNYATNTVKVDAYDFRAEIAMCVVVQCFGSVPI